jgi:hypothetical protein
MKRNQVWLCSICFALAIAVGACHRGPKLPPEIVPEIEAPLPEIKNASELVALMRNRYEGKWYKTLSWTQVNSYSIAGREQKSEWIENLSVPGKLRIDFTPLADKSGLLVENDNRVIVITGAKRTDTQRGIQSRPLLMADIYLLPIQTTLRRLDSLGVDVDKLRLDKIDNRRVFVIGAAEEGQRPSLETAFDAENLLFVRSVQIERRGGKVYRTEVRVTRYRDVNGFSVPEAFVTERDGSQALKETFTDVKVNKPMPASWFDATKWGAAKIAQ